MGLRRLHRPHVRDSATPFTSPRLDPEVGATEASLSLGVADSAPPTQRLTFGSTGGSATESD